ncbi:hypothetical protein LCGC14_1070420 [marine sediment metagenome]|uniref:Uncharacterized protein n=1 Tax=marine sediment metagenome TaxID=412755 RepID=A0A0F9MIG1_9ZZZZ
MAENWVKYPVSLGTDLKAGRITKDEFLLISYMLSQCDRETGIIVTNSRLLAIETDQDRKRVANLLSSLKKKSRIQSAVSGESTLSQKRGNTKPYDIRLCDALPNNGLVRGQSEASQRPVRGNDGREPEPAKTLSKIENGTILAKRDLDLDLEEDQEAAAQEVDNLVNLMQEKWPHPNPPNYATVRQMINKFGVSVCVDAMEKTPDDMVSDQWNSIYRYMREVAGDSIPDEVPAPIPEEDRAINSMKQLVDEFRTIGDNGQSRTGSTRQATINRLSPYRKWYDTIDNLGDIVGMELDEYEALMNGGAK